MIQIAQYTGAKIEIFFVSTKKVVKIFELKCIFYSLNVQNAIFHARKLRYLTGKCTIWKNGGGMMRNLLMQKALPSLRTA